jgi:hypothetical protein
MTTNKWRHSAWIVTVLLASLLVSACGSGSPARTQITSSKSVAAPAAAPTRRPASTATAKPGAAAGAAIPIKPLTDLSSLNATVTINGNGTLNGKPAQGELVAKLTTNNKKQSQIVVTGSLLGDVIAQVGGAAVSLFRPSKVTIYNVEEGTFIVVSGLFDVCVKPKDPKAAEALDQLNPQSLMNVLANNDVARGKLAGEEKKNGVAARHYVMDGKAFLAAAQKSADPNVRSFGQQLRSAKDAHLYVASDGGYPVAFRGSYNGALDALKFDGDFDVQIDLTGVNKNTPVNLPPACDNPISQ